MILQLFKVLQMDGGHVCCASLRYPCDINPVVGVGGRPTPNHHEFLFWPTPFLFLFWPTPFLLKK